MAELVLGAEPDLLTIPLYAGVPWWSVIETRPALAAGETVDVVFVDGEVWPGTVDPTRTTITFSASAATVDERLAGDERRAWLRLTDAQGVELPWAIGKAVRGQVSSR